MIFLSLVASSYQCYVSLSPCGEMRGTIQEFACMKETSPIAKNLMSSEDVNMAMFFLYTA